MTSPGPAFQECTGSCHENVPALMLVSSDLRSTDGLTVLARIEIVAIMVHYQPSYNTSHKMKPSDPLLLANVTLHCGMYPAGKVDSRYLAIPWQKELTVLIYTVPLVTVMLLFLWLSPSCFKKNNLLVLSFLASKRYWRSSSEHEKWY